MKRKTHELAVKRKDHTEYIYFARFGRRWVDLAPYGNCVLRAEEGLGK